MSTTVAMFTAHAVTCLWSAVDGLDITVDSRPTDAELVDVIAAAELAKRALAAVQARATAALALSVRDAEAAAGVPTTKRGRSLRTQVATARQTSPHTGGQHVGAADALVGELPETLAALRSGVIEEWTATKVVQATTCLSREDRGRVDASLAAVFTRPGVAGGQITREATALAQQADPAAAVARARKAATERCVTLRPAPDTMTYLSVLLPVADGVATYAALSRAADAHRNDHAPGDERGRGQVMADTAVARLTGRDPHTDPVPVVVNLVMSTDTLLQQGEDSASVAGHDPIPARLARELVSAAAEKDQAWVRRLFTAPDTAQLVALDSRQRIFPAGPADLIRLRDQRCAAPFCDAPIRHLDHVQAHARGGPTTAANGQGLCQACNHTKELPGVTVTRDPDTGTNTWRTPTGHAYSSSPPPVLGHPNLPDGREAARAWLRRVLTTAA